MNNCVDRLEFIIVRQNFIRINDYVRSIRSRSIEINYKYTKITNEKSSFNRFFNERQNKIHLINFGR